MEFGEIRNILIYQSPGTYKVHSMIYLEKDLFLPWPGSRARWAVVGTCNIRGWVPTGSASHRRFGLACLKYKLTLGLLLSVTGGKVNSVEL